MAALRRGRGTGSPASSTDTSVESAPAEPIRADLGRPETPEERAARKAENSRNYREAKTPNNLVIALVASLAIVLFLVLVVVRPTQDAAAPVDYQAVAEEAQPGVSAPLATPALPEQWSANAAALNATAGDSFTWYIGFVTPDQQFLALEQGIDAESDWYEDFLGSATPTSSVTVDGVEWDVFDRRGTDDPGNFAYAMAATVDGSDYLLHGTASDGEFALFASALASEFDSATTPAETTD
jgi:hypothetical protein